MKTNIIDDNLIVKLTLNFSLMIIEYCEKLESQRRFVISNQLLKSGTSIGANVWEAQNSESKPDFIDKFKIAAKEMDETHYWLLLCKYSPNYPELDILIEKLSEINRVITKIISTSKKSFKKS